MRQMGGMGGMGRIGGNNKKGGQGGFFGMVQAKTSTLDKTKDKIVFKVRHGVEGLLANPGPSLGSAPSGLGAGA